MGISEQYVDGLELHIQELKAALKSAGDSLLDNARRINELQERNAILNAENEVAWKRIAELEETNTLLKEMEVEHGNAFRELMLLSEARQARIAELEAQLQAVR